MTGSIMQEMNRKLKADFSLKSPLSLLKRRVKRLFILIKNSARSPICLQLKSSKKRGCILNKLSKLNICFSMPYFVVMLLLYREKWRKFPLKPNVYSYTIKIK
ncbi:hypothetical protein AP3564_17640 [Aeribacillus pallidus]|uniref:Uncharacterized protein n=1 Tax=Aeribacillus pallidus TaxID=33936 RepID=A0A223E994_9BACI|nr:hypothetical protein AP3564_17640 [Aeribacillus pallidus]